jgi:hypothetical protein
MIIFNGAIWHGHTANIIPDVRRPIQGYFVRRRVRSRFDIRKHLLPAARARMSPLGRYPLALDETQLTRSRKPTGVEEFPNLYSKIRSSRPSTVSPGALCEL